MSIINNNLTRVTLSILLALDSFVIFFVNNVLYNGVIKIGLYIVIISIAISCNVYLWEAVKQKGWLIQLIVLQLILLVAFPMTIWVFKPQYTFIQAKNEVVQRTDFLNGFKVQDKRHVNMKMHNSPNPLISHAYLLKVSKENGVESYIIFDPITGNYKFFE